MNSESFIWKFQTYLNYTHFWVMAINAVVTICYLCKNPSRYFNLRRPVHEPENPVPWILSIGVFVLPLYYAFETITTSCLCAFVMRNACMYTNHHVLTVTTFLVIFHYRYLNGPLLMTVGTHGLMNIGYYYNKFLQIFMCRWYLICSIFDLFYIAFTIYIYWNDKKLQWMGFQLFTFLGLIILNNILTPELVALCEKDENSELNTDWLEYSLNISFATLLIFLSRKFTEKEKRN